MRKSKFSESQIVGILKDAESGVPVADLLRKHGVSEASRVNPRSWPVTPDRRHYRQNPSPAPRFVSQLRFEPRPDIRQLPGPLHTDGRARSFDFITVWPGNGVTPIQAVAAPTGFVPPSESHLLGGVQLDVQPWRAQVYVDGANVGLVDDFSLATTITSNWFLGCT